MSDMGSGICPLVIIVTVSLMLVGFALLYREWLKDRPAYVYIGLITVILFVGMSGLAFPGTSECTGGHTYGVSIDEKPGMVEFTIVSVGNPDGAAEIAGPEGKRSTETRTRSINGTQEAILLQSGTRITLRSNEEVIDFLNNTNITVPTSSGIKTVENVSELPSEYQKAPEGFIDPDADIGNYDNASIATVACLYRTGDFELGERNISAGVSIPCSTPILGQNDIEEDYLGTHVKPSSGSNKDKNLVSPVTLKKGEYQLIGTIDGQKTVVQSVRVGDEIVGGGE
jgi:hypothetical protein